MFMSDWSSLMTPPPPRRPPWTSSVHFRDSYPIDVSQFQFPLSAVALDMYLYGLYLRYTVRRTYTVTQYITKQEQKRGQLFFFAAAGIASTPLFDKYRQASLPHVKKNNLERGRGSM